MKYQVYVFHINEISSICGKQYSSAFKLHQTWHFLSEDRR